MVPICTNVSCSWVSDSMKSSNEGILQFQIVRFPKRNVETNIEYIINRFKRMDRIRYYSLFSITHYFSWSTNDLNSLNKSWIVSKWVGFSEINSFSSWWPLISSFLPNNDSSFSHSSLVFVIMSKAFLMLCLNISRDHVFHVYSITIHNELYLNLDSLFGKTDDMRGN